MGPGGKEADLVTGLDTGEHGNETLKDASVERPDCLFRCWMWPDETRTIDERGESGSGVAAARQPHHRLRLLAVMSEGIPGELTEAWQFYADLDEARIGALTALRDARVLGVAIVNDHNSPLRLVEWMPSTTTTGKRPG